MAKKVVIEIVLREGILSPEQLGDLVNQVAQTAGEATEVVLSGRLPVWAFSACTGALATRGKRVATFDPRLQSGVVVFPTERAGELLPLDGAEKVVVEF